MLRTDRPAAAGPAVVQAAASPAGTPAAPRVASLDQFRGYTVAGMFAVNFLGSFAVVPAVLKHHNTYCSYADTIMPQFLFAVGFAFRLSFGRRAHALGLPAAYRRVARRLVALMLLAIVLYTLEAAVGDWDRWLKSPFVDTLGSLCKRHWFQTLMHIAVTSLWILPVIRAGAGVRAAFLILGALAHVALSGWFNFAWVNSPPNGIDGGPLGFLTWAIPALVGTFACDALTSRSTDSPSAKLLAGSVALMALGYGLSCGTRGYDVPASQQSAAVAQLADSPVRFSPGGLRGRAWSSLLAEPPLVPPPDLPERQWNYWMMSQRSGSVSYLTFAAGFALAVFVLFHLGCDRLGWGVGLLRTLGSNALAAYVLGGMVETAVKPLIAREAPPWQVAVGFVGFFAGAYLLVWLLERKGLLLRL